MKAKTILRGSAIFCTALLSFTLTLSAGTLSAETFNSQSQQSATKQSQATPTEITAQAMRDAASGSVSNEVAAVPVEEEEAVVPAAHYLATAYSLRGRTASGRPVSKGLIAADPRVLPLGSRVKLHDAGTYSGEYLVADTGAKVRGKRIDIWTPTSREAMRFGKRTIKLTVLSLGGKKRTTTSEVNPVTK